MSAAIAPNPNDPQAPLGTPARPWWIGYIRELHLDIPLAVESGGTGKNTPLDASDIAETDALKILTAEERTKLAGVADNANNYTHPASHPQSMIEGLADALAAKQNASNALTTNTDQIVNAIKTFYKPFITSPNATANYSAFSIGTVPNGLVWYLQFKPGTKELNWFTTKEGTYPVPMGFVWDPVVRAVFPVSPTVPTPPPGDNSTLASNTAFVQAKAAGELLTSGTMTETSTGSPGMIRYDSGKLYVCVATDTWIFFEKGSWT